MALDLLTPLQQGLQTRAFLDQRQAQQQETERLNQIRDLTQHASAGGRGSDAFKQLRGLDVDQANKLAGLLNTDMQGLDAAMEDFAVAKTLFSSDPSGQRAVDFLSQRSQLGQSMGRDMSHTNRLIADIQADPKQAFMEIDEFLNIPNMLKGSQKSPMQKGEGGLVFDPNTGEFKIDEVAKQRLDEIAQQKAQGGTLDFKDKQSINKDITSLLKDTTLINKTAKDLESLKKNPSGPASIALVFKFMKALDPTSVVREGEFATAENSAGVPEGIRNIFNKLSTGERLGAKQIDSFIQTAKGLSNSAVKSSESEINGYLDVYGDSIPDSFRDKVKGRIPSLFEEQKERTETDILAEYGL